MPNLGALLNSNKHSHDSSHLSFQLIVFTSAAVAVTAAAKLGPDAPRVEKSLVNSFPFSELKTGEHAHDEHHAHHAAHGEQDTPRAIQATNIQSILARQGYGPGDSEEPGKKCVQKVQAGAMHEYLSLK